jgi:AmmeMemoRadiSam system protein B
MLCFAAITPHPPVLIPAIGKDKIAAVAKTKQALQTLEQELYLSKPQIIVIISPHSSLFPDSFSVNAHTNFSSSFEEFGDVGTKKEWPGATDLAAKIAHRSRGGKIVIQLVSNPQLDHGATVPLFYLTEHLPEVKILPLGYSHLSASDHMLYGELLKDLIMESDKRIAVIASGDLSHGLDGKEGSERKKFDQELQATIKSRAVANLMLLEERAALSDECGYRSIMILIGIIKNMNYIFNVHCYEHPFGVGYLTASFSL